MADELLGYDLSFASWMAIGLPVSVVMLIACWALLTLVLFRLPNTPIPGVAEVIADEREKLGRWHLGERVTAFVFAAAAIAWIFRSPKQIGDLLIPGLQTLWPQIGDSTIAIAAALVLFRLAHAGPRGTAHHRA